MKFQTYISKSSINYNQQKKFENFLKTIPGVGQKIAKHIAKKFKNMKNFINVLDNSTSPHNFLYNQKISGISKTTLKNILDFIGF